MGIEAALLGAEALPWLTGASAAASATTGLIGAGGAFSLGTTLGTLGSALGGLSAISSIAGGSAANSAAKEQANLATFQAQQQGAESARQAQLEADMVGQEAESTRRRQKIAYLSSGVTLEGSPLLLMEATRQRGLQNVEEVFKAGGAATGAAATEGRLRASQLKGAGRTAFVSGIANAGQSIGKMF